MFRPGSGARTPSGLVNNFFIVPKNDQWPCAPRCGALPFNQCEACEAARQACCRSLARRNLQAAAAAAGQLARVLSERAGPPLGASSGRRPASAAGAAAAAAAAVAAAVAPAAARRPLCLGRRTWPRQPLRRPPCGAGLSLAAPSSGRRLAGTGRGRGRGRLRLLFSASAFGGCSARGLHAASLSSDLSASVSLVVLFAGSSFFLKRRRRRRKLPLSNMSRLLGSSVQ